MPVGDSGLTLVDKHVFRVDSGLGEGAHAFVGELHHLTVVRHKDSLLRESVLFGDPGMIAQERSVSLDRNQVFGLDQLMHGGEIVRLGVPARMHVHQFVVNDDSAFSIQLVAQRLNRAFVARNHR